jgi:hypothetical protein
VRRENREMQAGYQVLVYLIKTVEPEKPGKGKKERQEKSKDRDKPFSPTQDTVNKESEPHNKEKRESAEGKNAGKAQCKCGGKYLLEGICPVVYLEKVIQKNDEEDIRNEDRV